ncbi:MULTISPECIES: 8-amino-7-oxononanoate synthase [unclassified Neptuniibacter]|uniref:8-amino-7-oxononanoate synthase n=1 Tax=unclassified Neptuniibacter TaxID=2630693 RepID=UPI000C66F0BD|nr:MULTISPECIES: 8-amino-7-oxononanoate synthase [unclassified Neptuniibacter]MAY42710.1 8-amino-7-oxononanoate synthase [Oceanospirillaceae bacterium]|tara:strand:+ start:29402 stop:30559 length:1158 start_codon:yes stop_codon:yes gene_type:complete
MSFDDLSTELDLRKEQALYRCRRTLQTPQQPIVQVDGREYLAFCSNDYLGLANHPEVIKSFQTAANKYGVGGGASHLVNGHSQAHHELEEALAEFTGRPKALLFSTGYMANIGAVNALLGKQDAVFQDRLNHASLLDAGLLSGARFQRYLHNDSESLDKKLAKTEARRKLVVTDGVFSMDGDLAELPELSSVCKKHDAWLMVDDAHGFGCLGESGGGCAEHFSMPSDDLQVLVGTLGKGFGTAGAFVAGSEVLIETLVQHARTYIYTTSMPPAVAAATLTSLRLLQEESWRRDKLTQLIKQFRDGCQELGLTLMDSPTPIQPIMIGESDKAMQISKALEDDGIFISAIRPPTVPHGSARLRVTLSASHTEQQVERLLQSLEKVSV